ncbi:hypothetical protein H0176_23750 [Methylorubrum populi]|uniref:hypothetical protein n=1 Tax=Methylorubrum rhodesianum TaxID=29427 RepID=UPI00190C990F|nr:hypothetical protein [Methylorubrum rhodesianum]MBK3406247.1 hypothetical protein [Methylorubrum rhodesianum]MBY0143259.1 hypothetical protein [Methylorubrum populi]
MTPPVTTGALAAASDLIRESLRIGAPGLTVDTQRALLRSIMLKLTGKVLRPLMAERDAALAALQQVTAERDEARDLAYELKLAAAGGEDVPGSANLVTVEDVRRWRDEDARFVSTATSELARLRAEGEAKDRALKAKAEEQVAYWRERQRAEKCLEDGVSEDGQTYTPIGDEAAWQGGYCNGRMSEADWWLKTFQYWPDEAARAATAREGA